jgi:hypothetical protein
VTGGRDMYFVILYTLLEWLYIQLDLVKLEGFVGYEKKNQRINCALFLTVNLRILKKLTA